MEVSFDDDQPVTVAVHPHCSKHLTIGFISGTIQFASLHFKQQKVEIHAIKKLKRSVRKLSYSADGDHLYSICQNGALCVFDVEANKRIRCIQKSHDDKPNVLQVLPSFSTKGQQLATGDESGQIKTWDLRASEPLIATFNEQEDVINDTTINGPLLLAASSDGTLGTYDLRKRRPGVQSESMHSESLTIASNNRFCYVGSSDGYIEVFRAGEYGNLIDRIQTDHEFGIDCMCLPRRSDVLITAGNEDSELRLVHLNPNKCVGVAGSHSGGIQQMQITSDNKWLITVGWLESNIKFWKLPKILRKVPALQPGDTVKQDHRQSNGFFDGLIASD